MSENLPLYAVFGVAVAAIALIVLMTQCFDTLKEIRVSLRSNTILIPHSPGSVASVSDQIRNAMIEASQTAEGARARPEAFAEAGNGEWAIKGASDQGNG